MPTTKNNRWRLRPLVVLVLAGVGGGLGWLALATHHANEELRSQLTAVGLQKKKLQAELRQAAITVATRSAPVSAGPAIAGTAGPGTIAQAPAPRPPSFLDYAHDNPQLTNLWIANMRSKFRQFFGAMFENLHLTTVQREQFKDIYAAYIARQTDIGSVAKEKALEDNDPAIKKLSDDSLQQMDREFVNLLGEQGFHIYQDWFRALPVRGLVDGFAVQVSATDPLTLSQAEQLAQALVAASPTFQKGRKADAATLDWSAADHAAESLLTPSQFVAWKLGVAHNTFGPSRLDLELQKIYDAAKGTIPTNSTVR